MVCEIKYDLLLLSSNEMDNLFSRVATDIIGNLPYEIALSIISSLDLPSVVACMRVSRRWRALASDPLVWRSLFYQMVETRGWKINERKARILSEA